MKKGSECMETKFLKSRNSKYLGSRTEVNLPGVGILEIFIHKR